MADFAGLMLSEVAAGDPVFALRLAPVVGIEPHRDPVGLLTYNRRIWLKQLQTLQCWSSPNRRSREIRASNKRGFWVLLALVALCLFIAAVRGVKGIFDGPWR